MVAKIVLENPNIYDEIFADTEFKEEIKTTKEQFYVIKSEIHIIETQERANLLEEKKKKLIEGEEIEFEKLKEIDYASKQWMSRVKSIKVDMTSKAKGTVTFKVQNWGGETFQEYVRENVNIDRYILHHLI